MYFLKTAAQIFISSIILCAHTSTMVQCQDTGKSTPLIKVRDVVIYYDDRFYSAFPSAIKRNDGELIVAFRRAPDRKMFGENNYTHTDPNSYLVLVRSSDGENWTKEPELIYANPFGGSQDPCLIQLKDGTLICTSYGWALINPEGIKNLKKPIAQANSFVFLGGYILRSDDGGKKWIGPWYPPKLPTETVFNGIGEPLPAYNRGALFETVTGKILWAVAGSDSAVKGKTSVHLITSEDKGYTWKYSGLIATDDKASFNETSVYETPSGDIVAFLRTADMDDQACISRSKDGGKTFKWEKMGFRGHPLNALQLPDKKVLLTYGYRHQPFGIRARVLNPECTDYKTSQEIVIRDDGGNGDIGYPWPLLLDKNHVLVTYYFNKTNGTRHIAGTILRFPDN